MTDDRPIGEDDLQAYVDARLSPAREAAVRSYLKANPEAAAQAASYREQREALRTRLAFKAGEPIPSRLRVAHLAAERRRGLVRRLSAVAASVAWVALGGALGWSANEWAPPSAPPAMTAEGLSVAGKALVAHRTFAVEVVHPVEVTAAEEQHLVQWLSKRLGRPLPAPDLNGLGFRLMGGRLLPAGANPAAQFMYENREGVRTTVYVQAVDGEETGFRVAEERGVSSFYWVGDGFGYVISAGLARDRLLPLAEAVYRQLERAPRPRTTL
jgi:anti-sigma factor RsiW